MSVSGYHGIDTNHVMNVDQYPATHTQCKLPPTLDGLEHKWFSKYSFKQNPCLNNLSYMTRLCGCLSILGLGLNLLRSEPEYTFYSCFGDRNGKFWACDVCFHVTYLIQGLGRLTCYTNSWHLGRPPPPWCLLITDGPLLSLCHTYTLLCNKIKVNFHWKFKIQTGFTMICSSEPWLYITT